MRLQTVVRVIAGTVYVLLVVGTSVAVIAFDGYNGLVILLAILLAGGILIGKQIDDVRH